MANSVVAKPNPVVSQQPRAPPVIRTIVVIAATGRTSPRTEGARYRSSRRRCRGGFPAHCCRRLRNAADEIDLFGRERNHQRRRARHANPRDHYPGNRDSPRDSPPRVLDHAAEDWTEFHAGKGERDGCQRGLRSHGSPIRLKAFRGKRCCRTELVPGNAAADENQRSRTSCGIVRPISRAVIRFSANSTAPIGILRNLRTLRSTDPTLPQKQHECPRLPAAAPGVQVEIGEEIVACQHVYVVETERDA